MNKLFTKIASVSLGLALAAGVGVALGQKGAAKKAKAADYVAYSLSGLTKTSTDDKTHQSYTSPTPVTQSEVSWAVQGNTTMEPWRIGGLKKAYSSDPANTDDRTITSTTAVTTQNVSKVELEVGTASSITVNSLVLYVGTAEGLSDVSSVSGTFAASSTITFNRPDGKDWSNRFFTVKFNLTNNTTSNRYVQFKSLVFKYSVEVLDPDTVAVSGENSVAVGASTTLSATCTKGGSSTGVNQNVVWSSSDTSKAVVSATGEVTGVSNGNVTITAKAENDASVYGTKAITVTGGKTDDSFVAYVPDSFDESYGDKYVVVGGVYTHAKQIMKNEGVIQVQKDNGLLENVAPLTADITSIEIRFNADKAQGTGFKVQVSADGSSFTDLSGVEGYSGRYTYAVEGSGNRYFKLTGPTKNTIYLDEFLVSFGNAVEAKLVTLAAALNDILDSECTGSSDVSAISASKWAEVKAAYDGGDSEAKAALKAVEGLSYHEVNQFLERYDHIVAGYDYTNFLDRAVASSGVRVSGLTNENDTIMIIVVITAAVSALAFGALLLIKKKKHN